MKTLRRLCYVEMKRAITSLPLFILGAIVLSAMIGLIAFCSGRIFYKTDNTSNVSIGLVLENSSSTIEKVTKYIGEMDSFDNQISFQETTLEDAYQQLEKGEFIAFMIIPPNIFQSILDGTNERVTIVLPKNPSISTVLFQELALSGAKTLSSAQASIYAISDVFYTEELEETLDVVFKNINFKNLQYALVRESLYEKVITSTAGETSIYIYYIASGIVLFLLLWGITYCHFLEPHKKSFYSLLKKEGINAFQYISIKFIIVFLLYVISSLLIFAIAKFVLLLFEVTAFELAFSTLPILFSSILLVVSTIILIYKLAPTTSSGILLLFLASMILLLLSGGFIPLAFFPESIRIFSSYLPTTLLMKQMLALLSHTPSSLLQWNTIGYCLLYTVFFYIIIIYLEHKKWRKYE